MRNARGPERLLYVDGLRAVAVLSVVVFHAWQYAGAGGQPFIARGLQMAAHGVDLFFVLSGFCLAYPYLERLRACGSVDFSVAAYAAKRIARIVPPYWLALMIIVALGLANVIQKPPPPADIALQMLFLDRDVHYVAQPFWSLPVEFRWYFLFPLALLTYVRAPRCVLAVAIGSYVLFDLARMHDTPDFGTFPAFLAGILVADLSLKGSPLGRLAWPVFIIYGSLAFALEPDGNHAFYAVEPLGIVAIMALVALAGRTTALRTLLAHPALTRIGAASYGIYLMHAPILKQLETIDHVAPWLAGIAALVLSFAFSVLCERPFVSGPLRERIVRFLGARFAALAVWFGLPATLTLSALPYHATVEVETAASAIHAKRTHEDERVNFSLSQF